MRYTIFYMKWISSFFLIAILTMSLPMSVFAADPYANAYEQVTSGVISPGNALGAPDSIYTDLNESDASFVLDMGDSEEAMGDLTLYLYLLDYGAEVRVQFFDENWIKVFEEQDVIPAQSTQLTYSYDGDPYRYVKVWSLQDEAWKLDAVQSETFVGEEEPPTEEPPTEEPPAETPAAFSQGDLVKLPEFSAVYVIGANGDRHTFPNDVAYSTWFYTSGFTNVEEVDLETMASFDLEDNVTVRPGTYLVKVMSAPSVYAVEPGGVLRWITSEELAVHLYGADWASRVIDINDAFWPNYEIGAPVESAIHPDGSILLDETGVYWYVENGTRFEISADTWAEMEMNPALAIDEADDLWDLYVDGGDFVLTDDIQYPY